MSLSAGIREEAWLEGYEEQRLKSIRSLMVTMGLSVEQAMTALKIPEEDQAICREKLNK